MPYLKFTTVDHKQIEFSGNKYDDIANKINNSTTRILAKQHALAYVHEFFYRRSLQVQRQKSLLINDMNEVSRLDGLLDDAEDAEEEAKHKYDAAVKEELSGQVNNLPVNNITMNGSNTTTDINNNNNNNNTNTSSNAYNDIEVVDNNTGADDDFM